MEIDRTDGAGIVYETARAFQRIVKGVDLPQWEDLAEEQQAEALESYGYVADNPEYTTRQVYEEWVNEVAKDAGLPDREFLEIPEAERRMLYVTVTLNHLLACPIEDADEILDPDPIVDGEKQEATAAG